MSLSALRRDFESDSLQFSQERLDLPRVAQQCGLTILNAGHGTTASMLASGRPILQLPGQLEQTHKGMATARLGAGLGIGPNRTSQMSDALTEMLTSGRLAARAQRFAARYARFEPERQVASLTDRIHALVQALLPWEDPAETHDLKERFQRLFDVYPGVTRVGDVGHFYLPYIERVLRSFVNVRVLCLRCGREETIDSHLAWIAESSVDRSITGRRNGRDLRLMSGISVFRNTRPVT